MIDVRDTRSNRGYREGSRRGRQDERRCRLTDIEQARSIAIREYETIFIEPAQALERKPARLEQLPARYFVALELEEREHLGRASAWVVVGRLVPRAARHPHAVRSPPTARVIAGL